MGSPKLFLSDLDDTLLTGDKRISPATMAALQEFMDRGNVFCVCTGRSITSALKVCRKTGLSGENLYISCFNGGMIYYPHENRVIDRISVDNEDIEDLFDLLERGGVDCQTYDDTDVITRRDSPGLQRFLIIEPDPYIITDDVAGTLKNPACKVLGIELKDFSKLDRLRVEIEQRYRGKYYCMYSAPIYLEIMPVDAGKGSALVRLAGLLGIPLEDTMAAGDQENDISMIKAAGLGVAMINGIDSVRAAADVVTELDNNHDGLCEILKYFMNRE